jgi:hypothetical protein
MVDVIGYIGVEYDMKTGASSRYLYTRGTPTIFAGSRYRYLAPRIPLGYKELVDAMAEAMEKEASMTGTNIINSTDVDYGFTATKRSFEETMAEAKTLWNKVLQMHPEDGREKLRNVVVNVFSHDMQLSKATPEQQDMVELVIDDLKKLV